MLEMNTLFFQLSLSFRLHITREATRTAHNLACGQSDYPPRAFYLNLLDALLMGGEL
jgi:hypothetical protein